MDGVLNVRKASGPTSHDVVDEIRRIFAQRRVGHAGTLDPLALGVLVVCLGKATRVVEYLMGLTKEYCARMALGVSTDTQDSTGAIIAERDASGVTREAVEEAAAAFAGEIDQVPPMASAVKHEGKRLYTLARQGKTVARSPRKVTIYSIQVTSFGPEANPKSQITNHKSAGLLVRCSSGTYIRTLCADIGERLGCGAHMSALERTGVGRFRVEESVSIEDLETARQEGRLEDLVMSMDDALADLPAVAIAAEDVSRAANGVTVPCSGVNAESDRVRIHSPDGSLIGIGQVSRRQESWSVKPDKVLIGPPTPEPEGVP